MESNFATPSNLVSDSVSAFWQVHRSKESVLHETIIPKGVIEIIFNFETTQLQAQVNNRHITVPRCFIQGYSTSPIHLHLDGSQTFFGVVLNPAAVKYIFNFYPQIFANCVIDLTLIDSTFCFLWHKLGEQNNFNNRVQVFTDWLINRLPELNEREKAFNCFLNSDSNIQLSVTQLANLFCYSTKQLSRKIFELAGMNTEQTLLYKKYLKAVHLIHSSDLKLTEVAYLCHFCDQSHFIKTFKSLSYITPHEYVNRKSNIVGHIFENVH